MPIRDAPLPSAAILAALLLAAPRIASADPAPRTSSLSWVRLPGAEGCIGSRALATRVEERLGREVFVSPSRASVAVEGRVEPSPGGGFRAVITVADERGVALGAREIHTASPRCSAMDDDLALVIAVTIDPDAALAPPRPKPKPLGSRRPPPPPPLARPRTTDCPAPPPWRVSLEAGGAAMLGLLPRASGGVSIRSHVTPPRFFAFEVGGIVFPPVGAQQGSVRGSFQLAEAFASVCPLTLGAFGATLSACAGVQAGALHAQASGLGAGSPLEKGLFNLALEGRVRRRLVGPLVAGAGLGLAIPLLRTRFTYTASGTSTADLFTMAPVAGTIDLALGVEFP